MKQSKCYTCEKQTQNLLNANCGHKICFNCVKNNRNTHKCSYCSLMSASRKKLVGGLSPGKKEKLERDKERTTKTKSIQSKKYEDTSPFIDKSIKKSKVHMQSCSNYVENSMSQDPTKEVKLLCKQHHEPLTLFSKSTKQAICSMCLCSRPKFNQQIMPIKGAESFLRRENHIQRQQSRIILNEIEKCNKVMKVNHQQFQLYYGSHVKVLGEVFAKLHRELQEKERQVRERIDEFFVKKLRQCQEIQQDLSYLIQTLQTYREQNKQTNTLTQSLYVYSSFKVIKKTMKTLNLDYVSYANKNVSLLQYNKHPFNAALVGLIKFDQDLPLKHEEVISITKRRNRSASAHQKVSAKKESNVYSNKKKGSIAYEHVLNEKIGLGPETYQQIFKRTQQTDNKSNHPTQTYSYQHLSRPKHINSLNTYVHQNLQEQKQKQQPKHSNSTYSYNQQLSSGSFDYQLRTPIKNILGKDGKSFSGSGYKHVVESGNVQSESTQKKKQSQKSHDKVKKKKSDFNVFSTGSVSSGLNMNQQERSLYKRLLKTKFTKNMGQPSQQQVHILPDDNQQQQQQQFFQQQQSPPKVQQHENGQIDEGYDDDGE